MKNSGMNKYKKFLKDNYQLLLLFCGLSLLNIFFLCWSFNTYGLNFSSKTFVFILAGSIILEIILCAILFYAKYKSWSIQKLFLVLGLIVGIIYVFALPVGRAPDEGAHFARIYEITNGHLVSDISEDGHDWGSIEAENIGIVHDFSNNNVQYHEIVKHLTDYPDESTQTFNITSAGNYNAIEYAPHVIGMGLGKILHLPFLITAYLAKLFHLVTCIVILYFCIKYIPFLKKFIFFIAFLPITMQAMSSLSADGFITVIAIALTSFVLYSTYTLKSPFTKKHYLLILALCFVLSLSKVVYAFLCLLLFAIPKERFKGSKNKIITIFLIGGICAIALFSWLIISALPNSLVDPTNHDILFSNPFKYLAILLHSISTNLPLYLNGTLGGFLEWFNISLSPLYIYTSFIIFILLCNKTHDTYTVSRILRILSVVIFTIITLATFTAMFANWTKPGEVLIDGVQGRYFLPILMLIPLAFIPSKTSSSSRAYDKKQSSPKFVTHLQQNYYLYGFFIFESVYAITTIVCSHL